MNIAIRYGIRILMLYLLITAAASPPRAYAAGTTLHNIREGLHPGYSRLVIECEGDLPTAVGPVQGGSFPVRYADLTVSADLEKISSRLHGNLKKIKLQKENSGSQITFLLGTPGAQVKSFVMKSGTAPRTKYRLVIDVYPQSGKTAEEKNADAAAAALKPQPRQASRITTPPAEIRAAPMGTVTSPVPAPKTAAPVSSAPSATAEIATAKTASKQTAGSAKSAPQEEKNDQEASRWVYSGEADLVLRAADGEDQSSKFEEYRHISQPAAGSLSFEARKDERVYIRGSAAGVGQDDPTAAVEAGRYGNYNLDFRYDRLIHRYALGVKTLYSGVGSGNMTLNDGQQAALEAAAGNPVTQANLLNGYMTGASTGDPDVTRDQFKLGMNLIKFDPFTLKIQIGHETRKGTRPFAGAFNNSEIVELFEPIDYETTDMKISGEYARKNLLLNVAYQYSQFTNNIDALTFDNPLRATDAVLGPGTGRIDLAPDNQYHNLAFTGALTRLPWNSQVTANAAWGWMRQDDKLAPFTSNTAIASPALPVESADAQVNTYLYNLRLTSRPLSFMRVKADLRYYDYDNRTQQIDFSGGYVETDEFATGAAITNLPTSYTKTKAGLDLGFDVLTRTSLGLGYKFEHTDRQNREVEKQDDNIIKASLDSRALDWMDLRASFERTDRQIGDYTYNVYQRSGDNLNELPQMRKYDQADMVRDRYQVQATVYPSQPWSLTGAFTYGKDDFKDSPYGLLEDNHYIVSLDTQYAINERAGVNLFYTYEKYDNSQRGSESGTDWTADGDDRVHTIGGGMTLALIPKRLDFDLTYSYSDVDGNLAFTSPSGSFADFKTADDSSMHALNTKLKYHFSENLMLSLGYLWEKFDYEDYNRNGFAYVPTDTAGNYQGALLSGTLPQDYDVHIVYTQLTFRYK